MIFYGLFEMQKENKGLKAIGRFYLSKKSLYIMWILICSRKNVKVVCIDNTEDAQAIFCRIQEFMERVFEGGDAACR